MEDTRDYIERSISAHEKLLGREPTPTDIAASFAKMDSQTRAHILLQMEADNGPLSVNKAAKRVRFESAIRNTQKALRGR
jgi:hypothetical protein